MIERYGRQGQSPEFVRLGVVPETEPVEIQFGEEYKPVTPEEAKALAALLQEQPNSDLRFNSRPFHLAGFGNVTLQFEIDNNYNVQIRKRQIPEGKSEYYIEAPLGKVSIDVIFDQLRIESPGFGCTMRIGELELYSRNNNDVIRDTDPEGARFSFWNDGPKPGFFAGDLGDITVRFDPYPQQPTQSPS